MNIDISRFLKDKEDPQKEEPTKYGMLRQMNMGSYNMYAGTANPIAVRKRRAKNKVARKSRKASHAR